MDFKVGERRSHKTRHSSCLTESTEDSEASSQSSISEIQHVSHRQPDVPEGNNIGDVKSFAVAACKLPHLIKCRNDYTLHDFWDICFLCTGSNSNIYTGIRCSDGEKVVLKMIKEDAMYKKLAVQEFDEEFAMLCRLDHPNVVRE